MIIIHISYLKNLFMMTQSTLLLPDPENTIGEIISFLSDIFKKQGKTNAIIAISGGIDSALSLTLLAQSLPNNHIFPLFLPYGEQSIGDSQAICAFNGIPTENIQTIDIKPIVDLIQQSLSVQESYRLGNIMARTRMIAVYDRAKELDALVCGTENKSEKYLAYYTRFGDEASDIEPIQHLYKTQIRQLAEHFQIPGQFLTKPPSAGLWEGQTDESELEFSYDQADQVMWQYIDQKKKESEIAIDGQLEQAVVTKVIERIESHHFKHEVPYVM